MDFTLKQTSGFLPIRQPSGWFGDAIFFCEQCGCSEHINFADYEDDPARDPDVTLDVAWAAFIECAQNLANDTHQCEKGKHAGHETDL